jgi:hypothetical protein
MKCPEVKNFRVKESENKLNGGVKCEYTPTHMVNVLNFECPKINNHDSKQDNFDCHYEPSKTLGLKQSNQPPSNYGFYAVVIFVLLFLILGIYVYNK